MDRIICCAITALLAFVPHLSAQTNRCADVAHLQVANTRVSSASLLPKGPFPLPQVGPSARSVSLPAFCRVQGEVAPHIGFEVWMPARKWNGRLVAVGSGGFGGFIGYADLAAMLKRGYAVTANDTGHSGQSYAWMSDPAALLAWGHAATHDVAQPAKLIVRAYYARPAAYSYFDGCSTGGAQAMEEAEFYPEDFNGIIARSPGMYYSHLMLSFLWGLKATTDHAVLTQQKLQLLHSAVMKECGSPEEIRDGYLQNPLACHFQPVSLLCKQNDTGACLTHEEVKTAELIYQGPRNRRTGAQIYPGFAFGSEASRDFTGPLAAQYGWTLIQGPLATHYAVPLLQHMVFGENWDWHSFDFDRDVTVVDRRLHDKIDSVDPDLRPFESHNGKLIMIQGWGDPYNAQTLPIEYREQVIRAFAQKQPTEQAQRTVDGFFRLFMAPGMGHCGGGPGPGRTDPIAAVRQWVEKGKAPARLVARERETSPGEPAAQPISRPLCPYPESAQWTGKGSRDQAKNFVCSAPNLLH